MAGKSLAYVKLASPNRLNAETAADIINYAASLNLHSPLKLIVSKDKADIHLLIAIDKTQLSKLKKQLYATYSNVQLSDINKSVAEPKPSLSRAYKLKHHYAFPLNNVAEANPEAFSTLHAHLASLGSLEASLVFDILPHDPLKARVLRRRIVAGHKPYLTDPTWAGRIKKLGYISLMLSKSTLKTTSQVLTLSLASRPIRTNQPHSLSDQKAVMLLDKLYQPLYKVDFKVAIKASSLKLSQAALTDIELAINEFARQIGYQQFRPTEKAKADVYSVTDLAAIFQSLDDNPSQSSILPQPVKSTKRKGDLVIGVNSYRGKDQRLLLKQADRRQHVYIAGASGSGKSTLMANLIIQDIKAGHGISLIDPHGDLADLVLKTVPKDRRKDLIYFDPSDSDCKLRLNLLETKASPDQTVEAVLSLFNKLFPSTNNHRIEYVMRSAIKTALLLPNATIFTVFRLLTDNNFRLRVANQIKEPDLVNFWRNELGRAGDYQRVKMSFGVTSKLGRLMFYEPAKRIFGQPSSNLNMEDIMSQRRIFIANLAKGKLGEDGSNFFATALLTQLQLAALSRSNYAPSKRTAHFLYVDEFQNLAPEVFVQMLSEARKYKLYLTMAEQSPSQQDSKATSIILANVANLICFRLSAPADARLLLPLFNQELSATDLSNLAAHYFYFRSIGEDIHPLTQGHTLPFNSNQLKNRQVNHLPVLAAS